ncbi:radical SAM protein [Trichloromonas sp.]|uniref:radical SAM protein n=1 Tax=Trichloromonas sp. TaxID=3069249 RepID=UPI003D81A8AA
MDDPAWPDGYLRLSASASLKTLEQTFIYHRGRDELYELDTAALAFLARCDGSRLGRELTDDDEFVQFCLDEGLLEVVAEPSAIGVPVAQAPVPSLRYLELQLLHDCNLRCRHCYLGPPKPTRLDLAAAVAVSAEFADNGGLKLMLSGGEPLLYPDLQLFIEQTAELPVRRLLITNGTLLTAKNCRWLSVDEIQVSLDGWRDGHDLLRGEGSFELTLDGILAARHAGIPVSLATMIHQGNLEEFDRMQRFAEEIDAVSWGVDILCDAGNLTRNRSLKVPLEQATPLLDYGFGGGYHGPSEGFACGRHLLTVLPDGNAVKCGFYRDAPLGDARKGLIDCWLRLKHTPLSDLECRSCSVLSQCGGGCRFRAPHPLSPDPAMCCRFGKDPTSLDS